MNASSEAFWTDTEGHLIRTELRARGFTDLSTTVPDQGKWRWAVRYGWIDDLLTGPLAELADLDVEHFTYEVWRDALIEPNPHLADDALVERWMIHLARAIRDAHADVMRLEARLAARPDLRTPTMLARLRTVRQELQLLTFRQRIARQYVEEFDDRLRQYVGALTMEARRGCAADIRERLIHSYQGSSDAEGRLVVATDASGLGGEACGYGWITETGELGYGLTVTTEVHQAEMIAICRAAVASELSGRELLILSDNQGCVDLINRVLERGLDEVQRRSRHPLLWMRQAYAQRHRIKVIWIKGHRGHILNEAADRLAALAILEGNGTNPPAIADELADIRSRFIRPATAALGLRAPLTGPGTSRGRGLGPGGRRSWGRRRVRYEGDRCVLDELERGALEAELVRKRHSRPGLGAVFGGEQSRDGFDRGGVLIDGVFDGAGQSGQDREQSDRDGVRDEQAGLMASLRGRGGLG
jgi:ribonuclease HI